LAYQQTLDLRLRYEAVRAEVEQLTKELEETKMSHPEPVAYPLSEGAIDRGRKCLQDHGYFPAAEIVDHEWSKTAAKMGDEIEGLKRQLAERNQTILCLALSVEERDARIERMHQRLHDVARLCDSKQVGEMKP
jgi:uncharacterized coiled-coil protein SlyX